MIITVQCPACATSFPVDTDKVPEGGVDARCSVCADIFPVDKPSAEAEAGDETPRESATEAVAEGAPPVVEEAEPGAGEEAGVELEPEGEAGLDLEGEVETDLEVEAGLDLESEAGLDLEGEVEPDLEVEAEPDAEAEGWPGDFPSEAGVEPEPTTDDVLDAELTTDWADEPEPTADEVLDAGLTTDWEDEPEPTPDDVLDAELTTDWADEDGPAADEELEPTSGWEDERDDRGGTEDEHDDVVTAAWDLPAVEDDSIETEPVAAEDAGPETVEAEVEEDAPPTGTGFDLGGPASGGAVESEDLAEGAATFEADEPDTGVVPDTVEPPAEPPTGFQFGKRDPHEKAQRLARVLVSDMIMYNPERHGRALNGGTLKEDFEDEITKSWDEYVDQVGEEIARSTTYFSDALNEILARGEPLFEGNPPR